MGGILEQQVEPSNQTQIWFEMSQGKDTKMYTLWRCTSTLHGFNRQFIQNLSIDKTQALEKAQQLSNGRELVDDSLDSLKVITRGEDVIRFGKYKDQHISTLPDGYLQWVAQGAEVSADEKIRQYYEDATINLVGQIQQNIAKQECLKRGLYREYKGELVNCKLADKLQQRDELNSKSQYIGKIGEKIELKVIFERQSSFDNQWGTTYINIFRTREGSVITYFGKDLKGNFTSHQEIDIATGKVFEYNHDTMFNLSITNGRYHTFNEPTADEKRTPQARIVSDIVEHYQKEGRLESVNANIVELLKDNTLRFYNTEYQNFENHEDCYEFQLGKQYILQATVKEHSEYQGTKQTQVQRPKLIKS